jgi:ferredoxin-type protein NapH
MIGPYRRIVQVLMFCFMFAVPVLNLYEIYAVTGTFFSINIGGLAIADPSALLQTIFASGQLAVPLLGAALFPLLLAVMFGRVWCGWLCPYHVIADVAAWLRSGFRIRLLRKTEPPTFPIASSLHANLVRFSFLVLGTAAAGAIGIPVLNYVNAPGIVSTEAMILVKERSASIELVFILVLVFLELTWLPRFWCRLFCPTGAVISLFRSRFTLRVSSSVRNPKAPCCSDRTCSMACPMGLEAYREGSNSLCTNCGRCIDACPSRRLSFSGFHSIPNS